MKYNVAKIDPWRLVKVSALALAAFLIFNGGFSKRCFAAPPSDHSNVTTSIRDFTETILEKSFETLQFFWIKLISLLDSEASHYIMGVIKTIDEKPLVIASVVPMVLVALFVIYRSKKIKARRQRVLEELKESMEEDIQPLASEKVERTEESQPATPTETLLPSVLHEIVEASADSDPSKENFIGEDEEEKDILQILESTLDNIPLKGKPAAEPGGDEGDQDEILKKLEDEFLRLENEFQDVDALREEVTKKTPDEKGLSQIVTSFDETQEKDEENFTFDPLELMEKEFLEDDEVSSFADDNPTQTVDLDDEEEMDQSIVDLQEEMEQTIQQLSEQIEEDSEENFLGTSPTESQPEEKINESLSRKIEDTPIPDDLTEPVAVEDPPADDIAPATTLLEEEAISDKTQLETTTPAEELDPAIQPTAETPISEDNEELLDDRIPEIVETRDSVPVAGEIPELLEEPAVEQPKPTAELEVLVQEKIYIDPETAHRSISHLVNFQKSLENQFDKMEILSPREGIPKAPALKEATDQENLVLEPAEQNYEQAKNALKQKDFFDLLESFILLESQKKDD